MSKVGYTGLPMVEEMCVATTGAGETLTVGSEALAAIAWTGATVNTSITEGASSDLADPANWHTLVSITGGPLLVQLETYNGVNIVVDNTEGAGEGLALKVTIDGTIVFQSYVTTDGGGHSTQSWYPPKNVDVSAGSIASLPIYCGTSFAIHVAYKGDGFGDVVTAVNTPLIRYKFINPD